MSMRRGALAALAVASLTLGAGGGVRAVSTTLWALTATPLVATAGQSTTFHMLATNLVGPPAGCVNVEIPSSFVIQSASNVVASDGSTWVAAIVGTWVEVTSLSGIDHLDPLETVSFDIQLLPTQAGAWNWNNHVHVPQQCTGPAYPGLPVTVVVAPAILPTPVPTPIPTAVPTPVPTLPPLPTPIPTLPPLPTLRPDPTAAATPAPTATPRPSPTPQPVAVSPPSAPTGGAASVGRLADLGGPGTGSFGLGTDVVALLDAPLVWFVPGAVVGVPGLLVLLWIALQAVGALAWIPAVRRMSGEPIATRRRRRRPAQA
jgi:hypothetical protein